MPAGPQMCSCSCMLHAPRLIVKADALADTASSTERTESCPCMKLAHA